MNEFIKLIHSNFKTPKTFVSKFVGDKLNVNIVGVEKIEKGYNSEVYICKSEKGNSFVIKIGRLSKKPFEFEYWAMERAREVGVPVPEVLFIGKEDFYGDICEVMIQKAVIGRDLSEIMDTLPKHDLDRILYHAGRILRKLHTVKVGGFRKKQLDGSWHFNSWKESMEASICDRINEKEYILSAGFSDKEFDKMIYWMNYYKDNFDHPEAVLGHGDFSARHIFVNDKLEISSLIDFGDFKGAVPISDMLYFDFKILNLDISPIISGYGEKNLSTNLDLELNLARISHLGLIKFYLDYNKQRGLLKTRIKLAMALQSLEQADRLKRRKKFWITKKLVSKIATRKKSKA